MMLERANEVIARCREIAGISDVLGETTRTFLSPAMRQCNERVAAWMHEAGMSTRVDAMGSLRGLRVADEARDRRLLLGSHLDTVLNAGAFDGVLGVLMSLAVLEELRDTALPFAVEVIGFSDEEGVRFGAPFLGSRALVGSLDEALLSRTDEYGVSMLDAVMAHNAEHVSFEDALFDPASFGYVEFHIEQGPVLESRSQPLGVVEAIVGQSRYEVVFTGEANHAGTTPMHLRKDALAAAAEWVVAVERFAREHAGVVATVGRIAAKPGAVNAIAGDVRVSLDVRSATDAHRLEAVTRLLQAAEESGHTRGVVVHASPRIEQSAVAMDTGLTELLAEAMHGCGVEAVRMMSGAGHDAMVVAPHVPSAMLFVRSPRGLSHHPDEAVLVEDVAVALEAGVALVRALAEREAMHAGAW